ncbi:MAG: SH3 domain-containing protein [Kiritimatiellia bacterium]|jgi:uncharacterized protein YraI
MNPTRHAAAFLVLAVALVASAETYVAVKGERVNLRAEPVSDGWVVGQVSAPERLVLQGGLEEPWVKVTPPASVDLWIFAALVKDGKVNVNRAQVRAGGGLNYPAVGLLEQGDAVEVRGQVGDWLKIAPFPAAAVWITNCYVEAIGPAESATEPTPAAPDNAAAAAEPPAATPPQRPAPAPPAVEAAETKAPTETKAPLTGQIGPAKVPASRLRSNVDQALPGSYTGILALVPTGAHPTRFRLVVFTGDQPKTLCYVLGNHRQLDSLKGATFTIKGAVYWFADTHLPTIYAQNILRHKGR